MRAPGQSGQERASEFLDLASRAREAHTGGNAAKAIDLANRAELLLTEEPPEESTEVAGWINGLGAIFFETGYDLRARELYERALKMAENIEPADPIRKAAILNNIGQVSQRLGEIDRAEASLENAIRLLEKEAPDSFDLAASYDNLGNVQIHLRELDAAEHNIRRAIAMFEQRGGPFDIHVATACGNLGRVLKARGALLESEAALLRALDTHQRQTGLTAQPTLLGYANLAQMYRESGDTKKADDYTNILLSIGGEHPDERYRTLATLLMSLAKDAFHGFQLGLAVRLANRAVHILRTLEGQLAPSTLEALALLGIIHRSTNDRAGAQEILESVLSDYETLGMTKESTATRVELAKIHRETGATDLAKAFLVAAVEELRAGPSLDPADLASALGNLALVHFDAEEYDEADKAYRDAIDALGEEGGADRPWLVHNRAMLAYHLGRLDEAADLYEEAKSEWIRARGAQHPFVATVAANQALVHWAAGEPHSALEAFLEAEAIREPDVRRVLAVGSDAQRSAYSRQIQADLYKAVSFCLDDKVHHPEVDAFAAQLLLERKGRVLDALSHTFRHLRSHLSKEDQSTLHRLDAVRHEITTLIAPSLVARAPAHDRQRLASLCEDENRLAADLSYRGALRDVSLDHVTLATVQERIPSAAVLVEFLRFSVFDPVRSPGRDSWVSEHYAALVLRAQGEPSWFDLGAASAIDNAVDGWRTQLCRASSDLAVLRESARETRRLVLDPIAEQLVGAAHVLIAPDGKLALIPFGLLEGSDGEALSTRATVSYVSSGRDLARSGGAPPATGPMQIVAAPDFAADVASTRAQHESPVSRRSGFAPLPGTEQEARAIQALIPDAGLLIGSEANVEAVKALRRPRALHIATHGVFAPIPEPELEWTTNFTQIGGSTLLISQPRNVAFANPMFFSGLALAGANRLQGEVSTGILTAQEIAGLDLLGTELVVLSACETGLGSVEHGEEFMGLRRALSIAGCATQVTSLWKVADDATRTLMTYYYTLLLKGEERANALQLAQEQVRTDPDHPQWSHPFYWAAFVSAGAWGEISGWLDEDDTQRRPS